MPNSWPIYNPNYVVDPDKCHVETCAKMPTDCALRPECAGCGSLCFGDSWHQIDAWRENQQFSGTTHGGGGAWTIANAPASIKHVRAGGVTLEWKKIETAPGVYDWSTLWDLATRAQREYVLTGDRKAFWLYVWGGGGRSPDYIFEEGHGFRPVRISASFCRTRGRRRPRLPRVYVNGNGVHSSDVKEYCADNVHTSYDPSGCDDVGFIIPDYLDEMWFELYLGFHRKIEEQIRYILGNYTGVEFLFMQPCPGATGDNTPYHWTSSDDPNYMNFSTAPYVTCSKDADYFHYSRELVRRLKDDVFAHLINTTGLTILVNNNGGNETVFNIKYINDNLPDVYIKRGQEGHQFQSYGERKRFRDDIHWIHHVWPSGKAVRSRGEQSNECCYTGWPGFYGQVGAEADLSPGCRRRRQQMYSMVKYVITVKLDFWHTGFWRNSVNAGDYRMGGQWEMVNRYGGVRWGGQSPGAMIGFRDGLDLLDIERFPIDQFGQHYGSPSNRIRRGRAILATAAHRGAVVEDWDTMIKNTTLSHRRANAIFDVIPDILRDDYGVFMIQRNMSASVGWFNQYGDEQEIYGRFCRGYAEPDNPAAVIGLELDKGLWGGLPLTEPRRLTLRVAWRASSAGVFHLGYDSLTGPKMLAVNYDYSPLWRELCWRIVDGRFGQAPNANDIFLLNADSVGELFDSVEIVETPTWTSISVHPDGCDNYDENGNLLGMPPPPSPPPCVNWEPEWCSNKGARCDETAVMRDCPLLCGVCVLAPHSPPAPQTPPAPLPPPSPPVQPSPPSPPIVPMDCKNWCGPGQGTWEEICQLSFRNARCSACPECADL